MKTTNIVFTKLANLPLSLYPKWLFIPLSDISFIKFSRPVIEPSNISGSYWVNTVANGLFLPAVLFFTI